MTSGNVDCCKEGAEMKSVKFMKLICAFCAVGGVFFSVPAEAGGTHWSINIGVPVIAAPPPVAVYSNPVVPVATVVSPAPVMIHPHVVPRPVAVPSSGSSLERSALSRKPLSSPRPSVNQ